MNTALSTANLLTFLVLTMSGTLGTTPDPSQCPDGWPNMLSRCYYVSNTTATWSQAWDACADFRAHVISLETTAEIGKIKSYLEKHSPGTYNYWTSGSNDNADGHWAWYGTMTQLVYFNTCTDTAVLNDVNQNGHCLALSVDCSYKWIPEDCTNKTLRYICEKDADLPSTD